MTDRERVVKRLREKIKEAHDIEYDFVHITVGTARVIVRAAGGTGTCGGKSR